MAILRKNNHERYTVVNNDCICDDKLSLKALGLLVRLLSLPDNWEFSEEGLTKIFKKDGQSSIRTGLKELEEAGYLIRERKRDDKGRITSVEWTVLEQPQLENRNLDIPNWEFVPQYNTKEYNTKEFNTNSIKPYSPLSEKPEKANSKRRNSNSEEVDRVIADYTQEQEVISRLYDWLDIRKAKHAVNIASPIKKNLNKLDKMAKESGLSIVDYLDEVIARSWVAFYPIRNYAGKNTNNNQQNYLTSQDNYNVEKFWE